MQYPDRIDRSTPVPLDYHFSARELGKIPPEQVASSFLNMMALQARVIKGKLLRFDPFNIHPSLAVNDMVARGLAHILHQRFQIDSFSLDQEAVFAAVETSGSYMTYALGGAFRNTLGTDITLLRIRKGNNPSVMLYPDRIVTRNVRPITSGILDNLNGQMLHAEIPDDASRFGARTVILVDDVIATGGTLAGAGQIAREIFPYAHIVTATVFGKAQQRTVDTDGDAISLLTINRFGWNQRDGYALIEAEGFNSLVLQRAVESDFAKD